MEVEDQPHYIGVNLPAKQGISNQLVVDAAIAQGYDLITSRITSSYYRKRVQAMHISDQDVAETPFPVGEDLVIFPGSHISNTIALCAPWAELDSKDSRIAALSYKVLEHEFSYAIFCGLPYVVVEGPKRRTHLARYAHSLSKLLKTFPEMKVMIHTTFTEDFRDGVPPTDLLSTWEVWDGVRSMSGHPENLGVALDVQHNRVPDFVVTRWICEPIMMLVLGEACAFVPNPKNYPVLPKHSQSLVRALSRIRPFFLIKENLWPNKAVEFNGGDDACLIYLRNFLAPKNSRQSQISQNSRASRHVDAESTVSVPSQIMDDKLQSYHMRTLSGASNTTNEKDHALASYPSLASPQYQPLNADNFSDFEQLADVLEIPLQPLHNALSSEVYEIFEADTVKYNQYYRATASAIEDLLSRIDRHTTLNIAVLGAGRGALVDRVLDAVVTTRADAHHVVKIYAVEMHNAPLSFLAARKASEPVWQAVEIVKSDIRTWTPAEPMDLVVSELLGSFGDNELSPECLSAVENNSRVLKSSTGIMIPSQYSSYIAPLYSPLLWSKAKSDSRGSSSIDKGMGLEKPYAVYIRQGEMIAEPQRVWSFHHPFPAHMHNSGRREAKLTFSSRTKSRVYGFSGYFSAVLYGNITLSSLPHDYTPGLKSWFPMYFPIAQPLEVLKDSTIDISIWRETNQQRVWYEWAVETLFKRMRIGATEIHNTDGAAFSIHLY